MHDRKAGGAASKNFKADEGDEGDVLGRGASQSRD
jgi:hypothetical protein